MSLEAARRRAIEAVAAGFSSGSGPNDPFSAAAERGIEVVPSAELAASGLYLEIGSDALIVYATAGRTREFQRFSVAHELGHHALHRRSGRLPRPVLEREADFFAGCMLMPREVVTSTWRESLGDPIVAGERLAARCAVSVTAASIRLVEVVESAIMVVMVSDGIVRQWRANDAVAVHGRLPKLAGGPLPQGALALRLGGDVGRLSGPARNRTWFREDADGFTEHARTLRGPHQTLTALAR